MTATLAPLVEPHPSTLPDTREAGSPLAHVLVPCDGCGAMRHPDDLDTVPDCRDWGYPADLCDECRA